MPRWLIGFLIFAAALLARPPETAWAQTPVPPQADGTLPSLAPELFLVELAAPTARPLVGEFVLRPLDGGEPLRIAVGRGGPPLIPGSRWEVALVAEGFWAARQLLVVDHKSPRPALRFRVWPLGVVEGDLLLAERDATPPNSLEVAVLLPAAPSADLPRGRTGCEVVRPAASPGAPVAPPALPLRIGYRCLLPATKLDLSFQPSGYAPFYRRGVEITATQPRRIEDVILRKGGSIVGWVRAEGGLPILGRPVVKVEPALGPAAGAPRLDASVRSTALSAPVGDDGSFEIVALAAGAYRLRVDLPGFSPFLSGPIEVFAGVQTLLQETIILLQPVDLEVLIQPSVDPQGERWRLQLIRNQGAASTAEFEGVANEEGIVRAPAVDAAVYTATVASAAGDEYWKDAEFDVMGPQTQQSVVELELWQVKGKISRGAEPLAAVIWFGGRYGAPRVQASSDDEGNFALTLPSLGHWFVEVDWGGRPSPAVRLDARVLPLGERRGEVDLVIPAVRAFGRVLDVEGKPLAGARVSAEHDGTSQRTETNARGDFELDGLSQGKWTFFASHGAPTGRTMSEPVVHFVSDESEVGPLTLRLDKSGRWKGSVVSAQGPVVGATVHLLPWRPFPHLGDQVRTDLDGQFQAELPSSVAEVIATTQAPGFGLRSSLWQPARGPIRISNEKGDLRILFPEQVFRAQAPDQIPLVVQDGVPIPIAALAGWAHLQGVNLIPFQAIARLPSLAPAVYRVCLTTVAATYAPDSIDPRRCAEGVLVAGAVLELDLRGVEGRRP